MFTHFQYHTPLGPITMAADSEGLVGLWFDQQLHFASILGGNLDKSVEKDCKFFAQAREWLDDYFCGRIPKRIPTIHLIGTEFQQLVWRTLLQIPYGRTVSYAAIARKIADCKGIRSMSAQAVGCAVGRNPISIIIPCHRVLGASGSLVGYAAGIDIKQSLLLVEKISVEKSYNFVV